MKKQDVFDAYVSCIMNTYSRFPIVFTKGKGSFLWDIDGKKYIDLFPGWAVSVLGHCPSSVINGIRYQAARLVHLPNNFYHIQQAKLAKELCLLLPFEAKAFFCNSGAEAVEGALKLARAWGASRGKKKIIAMKNSFHGRTMGALTLTGQSVYQQGFDPLVPAVETVEFNDINALEQAIDEKTCAVALELVQGEGGVNIASEEYVGAVRELCDKKDVLLIFDEVQTGIGRCGQWFCFQNYDVCPDIMTLAKGLGGGVPIGAVVARKHIADVFRPGMHATTFGGSPLVCKASLGVLKEIRKKGLLKRVRRLSDKCVDLFKSWQKRWPDKIKDVRAMGFMFGIELKAECKGIVESSLRKGLLINCTHGKVLRIMPALNIPEKVLFSGLEILEGVLDEAFSVD